jgi:hypothetical protein
MVTMRPERTDAAPGSPNGQRGLGSLLRELADGGGALVRREVQLARLEVMDLVGAVGRGTMWVGLGGTLLLLGLLATLTGLILLGGDQWLRDHVWLSALIAMVVALAAAAWLARRGLAMLSAERLAPDQTVATLKEDKEWLKRRLTSGATSS